MIPNGSSRTRGSADNDEHGRQQQVEVQQIGVKASAAMNQFDDDEDLFKLDTRGKFISATTQQQQQQHQAANDDDEEEATDRRQPPLWLVGDPLSAASEAPTSDAADLADWRTDSVNETSNAEIDPSPSSSSDNNESSLSSRHNQHAVRGTNQFHSANKATHSATAARDPDYYNGRGVFAMDGYLAGSLDSTRLRLAKLVHKIAPELSCYTGNGEHYRGNVSTSQDGRVCLNWALARAAVVAAVATRNSKVNQNYNQNQIQDNNELQQNNNCRNPNLDRRGPWCYVHYEERLDGPFSQVDPFSQQSTLATNFITIFIKQSSSSPNSSNKSLAASAVQHQKPITASLRYVRRQCSVSACSEYLWFYIVAPPLGFLLVLTCLVTILVRSMRKSHYNSIFSVDSSSGSKQQRVVIAGRLSKPLNRLLQSRGRFAHKKPFRSSLGKKSATTLGQGHYLDDDIFEIVDDLDWSDGQTQSLSPKSTESLKLTSSFTSSSNSHADADSSISTRISACKSTNPIFCDKLPNELLQLASSTTNSGDLISHKQNCSAQQVGPMFATLRCHIRGKQAGNQMGCFNASSNNKNNNNKSSTFIEQCDLATSNRREHFNCSQQSAASKADNALPTSLLASSSQVGISSMEPQCRPLIPIQPTQTNSTTTTTSGSHLISYSSSNSIEDAAAAAAAATAAVSVEEGEQFGDCSEKFIIGNELPKFESSSVAIALEQQQPLYEGKFSQVRLAYITEPTTNNKQQQNDLSNNNNNNNNTTSGRIGAQVAVCLLKSNVQANFDTQLFSASRLRLRNLNHLNLLKLIGNVQLNDEIRLSYNDSSSFSLIYDMAQLVDLSDWLKQQSKDSMTSSEPGNDFGIRRHLTCFAKQIALALDYLHDKEIVYKDLACRNCFLDPTKMLIKLASFNLEPIINESDNKNAQNLKSMIRPKYLLDYYVIDSRPSDCQLLPLSWIPLESILFNKFNKQTDVWSFGCLIYELFSLGEVAYFGYSSKQVIDAVRSNLTPPQPLLCPNGIYKLMCKCLSDIPTIRPNVKQIYELLNLYSGQCSSFLDHHLCSLNTHTCDDYQQMIGSSASQAAREPIIAHKSKSSLTGLTNNSNSITKTKSYANIRNFNSPTTNQSNQQSKPVYHNLPAAKELLTANCRVEVAKLPLSKSINMVVSNRSMSSVSCLNQNQQVSISNDHNHYDEPILDMRKQD